MARVSLTKPVTVGIHGDAAMVAQGIGQLASIAGDADRSGGETLYNSEALYSKPGFSRPSVAR